MAARPSADDASWTRLSAAGAIAGAPRWTTTPELRDVCTASTRAGPDASPRRSPRYFRALAPTPSITQGDIHAPVHPHPPPADGSHCRNRAAHEPGDGTSGRQLAQQAGDAHR